VSSSSIPDVLQRTTAKTPLWLWPNLLSLDAPLVAAVWQALFARDAGVSLALASRAALPLAVWLIYLADRLLDTAPGAPVKATARHLFYRTHRSVCCWLSGTVAIFLCISVLFLPLRVLLNGLTVACLVAVYLVVVHGMGGAPRRWLPKEVAVGLIFGIGTVLAPFTRASHAPELLFPALLFGLLCWANSSAIEIWEGGHADRASAWVAGHLKTVAGATCVLCLPLLFWHFSQNSAMALFISALGYWGLADAHAEFGANALRVAVDVPLLAPLLLLGLAVI
jgi:hypothetical protein